MVAMLPTAHIASALLASRLLGLERARAAAILGALVPDMIDKTLAWVLGAVPTARHIGHTPLVAGALAAALRALSGRARASAFVIAYLAHLLGDLWDGGHIPWLMPLRRYDRQGDRWDVHLTPQLLLLEALGALVIVALSRAPAREAAP